jgi:hypothetical protein
MRAPACIDGDTGRPGRWLGSGGRGSGGGFRAEGPGSGAGAASAGSGPPKRNTAATVPAIHGLYRRPAGDILFLMEDLLDMFL